MNLANPQTLSGAGLEVGALLALWHPEASETRCMLTLVLGHKGMAPGHSMPFAQADKLPLLARQYVCTPSVKVFNHGHWIPCLRMGGACSQICDWGEWLLRPVCWAAATLMSTA